MPTEKSSAPGLGGPPSPDRPYDPGRSNRKNNTRCPPRRSNLPSPTLASLAADNKGSTPRPRKRTSIPTHEAESQPESSPSRSAGPESTRFYLGYTAIGIAQISVTIITFGIGWIWAIIEGILILTRDRRFLTDATGRPLRD